ncbi:MAG: aldo/keto reductase, partial [Vicinamibacterales bacterium]
RIAVVGYSPLSRGGVTRGAVVDVARRHGKTAAQVALNFLTRRPWVFAIAKATRPEHVVENSAALDFTLSRQDVLAIDGADRR